MEEQLMQKIREIIDEMKSSDYEHLILTFDKYFGEYVILETTDKKLLLI